MGSPNRAGRYLAAGIAALVALAGAAFAATHHSTPATARAQAPVLTGTVSVSGSACGPSTCWTCKGPVELDALQVTADDTVGRQDAVKLAAGCTGHIGTVTIASYSGDAVKIASGAHDLTIGGGSITCPARFGQVHQDGIQAMGGSYITFTGVAVACPSTAWARLDHSGFFVNGAQPPDHVLFTGGSIGSSGTTVDLGSSIASGVSYSTICPSLVVRDAVRIPTAPSGGLPPAVDPVDTGNVKPAAAC